MNWLRNRLGRQIHEILFVLSDWGRKQKNSIGSSHFAIDSYVGIPGAPVYMSGAPVYMSVPHLVPLICLSTATLSPKSLLIAPHDLILYRSQACLCCLNCQDVCFVSPPHMTNLDLCAFGHASRALCAPQPEHVRTIYEHRSFKVRILCKPRMPSFPYRT